MEMHIRVPRKSLGTSELERKAQIILWGYEDPVRWAVYNEKRKAEALAKAKMLK